MAHRHGREKASEVGLGGKAAVLVQHGFEVTEYEEASKHALKYMAGISGGGVKI